MIHYNVLDSDEESVFVNPHSVLKCDNDNDKTRSNWRVGTSDKENNKTSIWSSRDIEEHGSCNVNNATKDWLD